MPASTLTPVPIGNAPLIAPLASSDSPVDLTTRTLEELVALDISNFSLRRRAHSATIESHT